MMLKKNEKNLGPFHDIGMDELFISKTKIYCANREYKLEYKQS